MEGNENFIVSRRILLKAGIWFSLINSIFFLLLATRYYSYLDESVIAEKPIYILFTTIVHSIILSFIPFVFIFLPITILTKNKTKSAIAASVGQTIITILFTIDAVIYSSYRFHFNKYVMEQVFAPGATQVFELSPKLYILTFALLTIFIIIELSLFKVSYKLANRYNVKSIYIILGILAFSFSLSNIFHIYYKAHQDRAIMSFDRCLPFYAPFDINKPLSMVGLAEELPSYATSFKQQRYNYPKSELTSNPTGKNIVMVVLDSWRYDILNEATMPNIYNFSKIAERYHNHYSGSNGTKSGMFSLMYGMPAVFFNDFANHTIPPALMQVLLASDYDVRLFPSASLRNPPLDNTAFSLYYDQCDATEGDKAWQRDRNLANNFMKYVAERDTTKPFYALLFFDSLHSMIEPEDGNKLPFQPAWSYPKYATLNKNSDPKEFLNLYKNMAFYIDKIMGDVFAQMKNLGLMENTIIIITADHAQEFNENGKGYWGHNGNYSRQQLHVPLLYFDASRGSADIDKWTSHYDVAPTLMQEVMGVTNPASDYAFGASLHDSTYSRQTLLVDSYIGYGIIDEEGYITNIYYDGDYEIYDSKMNIELKRSFNQELYDQYYNQIEDFFAKK